MLHHACSRHTKEPSRWDVHQMKALSQYFDRPGKDNSTVYFYAQVSFVPQVLLT